MTATAHSAAARVLLVTDASVELRRSLGIAAWAVLEDVALDSVVDESGRLVAVTNVRRIAARLGISKDTAAAALARLAGRGLVERRSVGRSDGGRFGRSVYAVCLDDSVGIATLASGAVPPSLDAPRGTVASMPGRARSRRPVPVPVPPPSDRRRPGSTPVEQRPLFDLDEEPTP